MTLVRSGGSRISQRTWTKPHYLTIFLHENERNWAEGGGSASGSHHATPRSAIQQQSLTTGMHSSRMRTGRTLTVVRCLVPAGGGGGWGGARRGVYPQRKHKESRNQKKIPSPKMETPLKKLETPLDWPARHAGIPPPPVDRQTLVKILPWPKLRFGR